MVNLITVNLAQFDNLASINEKAIYFILDTGRIYTHAKFINGVFPGTSNDGYIPLNIAGSSYSVALSGHVHSNYYLKNENIDIGNHKIVSTYEINNENTVLDLVSATALNLSIGNSNLGLKLYSNGLINVNNTNTVITSNLLTVGANYISYNPNGSANPSYSYFVKSSGGIISTNIESSFNSCVNPSLVGVISKDTSKYAYLTISDQGVTPLWGQLRISIASTPALLFRTSANSNNWYNISFGGGGTYKIMKINGSDYSLMTTNSDNLPTILAPTSPGIGFLKGAVALDGTFTWIWDNSSYSYSLPIAATDALGGIIVSNALTTEVTLTSTDGATTGRYYGVQVDKDGKAFVNIPWENTWTQFAGATSSSDGTAGYLAAPGIVNKDNFLRGDGTWQPITSNVDSALYVGASNGTSTSALNTNGNVYLIFKEGTSYSKYLLNGTGRASVTSDASGNITINSAGYSNFTVATASAAGSAGLVPAPGVNQLGDSGYYLKANGSWDIPTNTWLAATTSQAGYVPLLAATGNTIASTDTAYVLVYKSGVQNTTTPEWMQLPSNAYSTAIENLTDWASVSTNLTASDITFPKVWWKVAPTNSNQVFGIGINPANGILCYIYNNQGSYMAEAYSRTNPNTLYYLTLNGEIKGTSGTTDLGTIYAPTSVDNGFLKCTVGNNNAITWSWDSTNYLPLTGGDVTGNINFRGTHDLSKSDNDIAETKYYTSFCILDKERRISARLENLIFLSGTNGFYLYARLYDSSGLMTELKGLKYLMLKNGLGTWTVDDAPAFRTAIGLDNPVLYRNFGENSIDAESGCFFYGGYVANSHDFVGIQVGDSLDKWLISALPPGYTLRWRQNDAGGTDTNWLDWKAILDSSNYSSYALPLTGGIMTGIISKDAGGRWISARDNVLIKTTRTASEGWDWHPAVGVKTSLGFWSFGSVGGEHLGFSYDTDADYALNDNTKNKVINIPLKGGTIALTSDLSSYLPLSGGTLTNSCAFDTSILKIIDENNTIEHKRLIWALSPNLGLYLNTEISLGKAVSGNNLGQIVYTHDSDGSNNNHLSLGIYGLGNGLSLYGNRKVRIGVITEDSLAPSYTLQVDGDMCTEGVIHTRHVFEVYNGSSSTKQSAYMRFTRDGVNGNDYASLGWNGTNVRLCAMGGTGNYTSEQDLLLIGYDKQLKLQAPQGTAPLTTSSTTLCSNLNADLLDGQHGSSFIYINTSENSDISLANGTDLNNVVSAGTYCIQSGVNASTMSNIPYTGGNSRLWHIVNTGTDGADSNQWSALILLAPNEARMFIRSHNNNTFGSWKEFAFLSDITTATAATASALGVIKVSNVLDSAVTLTSGNGDTADRYYGVQIDSAGLAFVNIPCALNNHTHDVISFRTGINASTLAGDSSYVTGLSAHPIYNSGYPFTYGNVLNLFGSGSNLIAILWNSDYSDSSSASTIDGLSTEMYIRGRRDNQTKWTGWTRVVTNKNFSSIITASSIGAATSNHSHPPVLSTASSVASLNVSSDIIYVSTTSSSTLYMSLNGALSTGLVLTVIFYNGSSSTVSITVPAAWKSLDGYTINASASKFAEISILRYSSGSNDYLVSSKVQ